MVTVSFQISFPLCPWFMGKNGRELWGKFLHSSSQFPISWSQSGLWFDLEPRLFHLLLHIQLYLLTHVTSIQIPLLNKQLDSVLEFVLMSVFFTFYSLHNLFWSVYCMWFLSQCFLDSVVVNWLTLNT